MSSTETHLRRIARTKGCLRAEAMLRGGTARVVAGSEEALLQLIWLAIWLGWQPSQMVTQKMRQSLKLAETSAALEALQYAKFCLDTETMTLEIVDNDLHYQRKETNL